MRGRLHPQPWVPNLSLCSVWCRGACTPGPSSQTQPHLGCHISHGAGTDTQTPPSTAEHELVSRVCPEALLGDCRCPGMISGVVLGIFLPHWGFSKQETATSKTLAHARAQEKCQQNWSSHWQQPTTPARGQPCPLPVWILPCMCLVHPCARPVTLAQ